MFTHYEVQELYHRLLWRSAAQALGHVHGVRSSSDQVTSIFWCQILQTVRTYSILSKPTLWITVTETVVKAQRNLRWEIETMEVESGSHRGETILLSALSTSTKPPTIATQLSLALQQILCFHSR